MHWWNNKYGKNSLCAITQSRLRCGKNKYGLTHCIYLNCNHGFYRTALMGWVLSKPLETPTCPMCRKEFDPILIFL